MTVAVPRLCQPMLEPTTSSSATHAAPMKAMSELASRMPPPPIEAALVRVKGRGRGRGRVRSP